MDRRNFFKIVSSVSAGAATVACDSTSKKTDALIPLLVPDHEIVPGEEQWHPSICSGCEAGCATIVRVMRAERIIERGGQKFREPIAAIKKIEGNPLDSVSGGRLCARGQAQLQSLYNPDRLREPMRRTGTRGKAVFAAISWDEAIAMASEKLAKIHATDPSKILFLAASQSGTRALNIQHFLEALGAPGALSSSLGSMALERKAAAQVFGWNGVPRYDLGNARYVLGVGADFLGGWASPVFYARQYGHFRQGRPGLRGQLVQAESRLSLTAASADEWLPIQPGSEPQFLAAIARILLDEKLNRGVIGDEIRTANLAELIHAIGIPEKRLRRIARELGESESPLVLAGASSIHTNSLDALIAGHHLNLLLGNVGHPGGLLPPNSSESPSFQEADIASALKRAQILFLDGENPCYTQTGAGLSNVETIISFGNFIDDSAAFADLILPDHHALESEAAVMPPVSGTTVAVAITQPFVRPLHNTRPLAQTLADIARKISLPFTPVTAQTYVEPFLKEGETWNAVALQGGLWRDEAAPALNLKPLSSKLEWAAATFTGDPGRFPLQFQPYLSLQYHDGRGANLPWMQELPDPASSSMWGLPVEIDPKTAAQHNIATGDWVRVESAQGAVEAQAYVHPAALPGVVSMAIGDGHARYGRYASERGANPLFVLASLHEPSTQTRILGATRVRLEKSSAKPKTLTQFSPTDREQGPWGYR